MIGARIGANRSILLAPILKESPGTHSRANTGVSWPIFVESLTSWDKSNLFRFGLVSLTELKIFFIKCY